VAGYNRSVWPPAGHYIGTTGTPSILYARLAIFGGMSDWFLNYHQVLEYRLIGMTTLLGVFALCTALASGLCIGSRQLLRHVLHGLPICQRRTP
jgi:hypothetical protein